MSDAPDILPRLGLDRVVAEPAFPRDAAGNFADAGAARVVFASAELIRGLHRVLERERSGAWRMIMKTSGEASGRHIAATLDASLLAGGKSPLAALPLEACLALLVRTFAVHGWGRLHVDLTHAAEHGLVVARLSHSCFVEALRDATGFADAMIAGALQAFFEHITGQGLACEELGCARSGDASCTFVITAPEKLAPALPRIGRESPDAILARLTSPAR